MIVTRLTSFSAFLDFYKKYEDEKNSLNQRRNVLLYFTGSDDPVTKKSWCPDCVVSKPVITEVIEKFKSDERISLGIVEVGLRDEWKRPDNPYRTHAVKITSVPTLLNLRTVSRMQ